MLWLDGQYSFFQSLERFQVWVCVILGLKASDALMNGLQARAGR